MVKNDIFSYFNTARMRQSDRMTIASCGDKNSVNTAARPPNGSNVLSNYIFFVRNTYATQYKARNHCDVFRRRVCLFVVRAECFVQYHSLKAGLLFGHVLLGVCSYLFKLCKGPTLQCSGCWIGIWAAVPCLLVPLWMRDILYSLYALWHVIMTVCRWIWQCFISPPGIACRRAYGLLMLHFHLSQWFLWRPIISEFTKLSHTVCI